MLLGCMKIPLGVTWELGMVEVQMVRYIGISLTMPVVPILAE